MFILPCFSHKNTIRILKVPRTVVGSIVFWFLRNRVQTQISLCLRSRLVSNTSDVPLLIRTSQCLMFIHYTRNIVDHLHHGELSKVWIKSCSSRSFCVFFVFNFRKLYYLYISSFVVNSTPWTPMAGTFKHLKRFSVFNPMMKVLPPLPVPFSWEVFYTVCLSSC